MLRNQKEDLFCREFSLDINSGFTELTYVRNGKLWAILENHTLIFSDLERKPAPCVTTFDKLGQCFYLWISQDGEYCFVNTLDNNHYLIQCSDMHPQQLHVLPNSSAKSACFLRKEKCPKPYLFIGLNTGQVLYQNLNKITIGINVFPVLLDSQECVNGIAAVYYPHVEYYGLYVFAGNKLHTFVLANDLTDVDCIKPIIESIKNVRKIKNCFFSFGYRMGVLTNDSVVMYNTDIDFTKQNTIKQSIITKEFSIPQGPIGFSLYHEVMFLYNDCKVNIFIEGKRRIIDSYEYKCKNFDFDIDNCDMYAFNDNKITRITFGIETDLEGPNQLRYWLFKRAYANKHNRISAKLLSRLSFSFDKLLKIARQSPKLNLYFFINLLEDINPEQILQRAAIAVSAVDLYARIECQKEKPHLKEFCSFTQSLLKEKLIDMKTVNQILAVYGWESPFTLLTDNYSIFNKHMELNDTKKAIEVLPEIEDDEQFADASLRVYLDNMEEVSKIVTQRKDLSNYKLSPIILGEELAEFVPTLLGSGRLTKPWLRRVFATQISKHPDENLIMKFFGNENMCEEDKLFLFRCLLAQKQYKILSLGLVQYKDYMNAAVIAARADPECAFDVLPLSLPSEMKKMCATRVLRSLPREDAEKLAHKLLGIYNGGGVDTMTLLNFLPKTAKIQDLDSAICEYVEEKDEIAKEQKKNFDDALSGIDRAQNLIAQIEEHAVTLSSTDLCEKCHRPLFTEPGIVFPCSHLLHKKCAKQIIKSFKFEQSESKIDIKSDCPICGYLGVRLIKHVFRNPETMNGKIDPWTTNELDLTKLLKE